MIEVEFDAAPIFEQLERAAGLLGDLTPVHQDITAYMVDATKRRFITSTAPDGTRWRDKSPVTLAAYLARGDGKRPDPLIGATKRLSSEVAGIAGRDSSEIGSALIYSGVMQEGAAQGAFGRSPRGGPIPWGAIPARPWLGISDDDEANILDIVDEHLEDSAR